MSLARLAEVVAVLALCLVLIVLSVIYSVLFLPDMLESWVER